MVDLVDIGFSINTAQIKTAKQELAELGNSFNSATKSASIFEQAFARAAAQSAKDAAFLRDTVRANQELINANLGVSNSYKSAKDSASAFGVVLSNIDKASKAFAANFNGVVGITGGRATSNGAGFGAIESEIERLRLKYDQIYASSQLYEKSLEELNRAHMLGVTSVKQHEAALESLNMEYQNFQNGVAQAGNRFAQYSAQTASGMNKFGVVTQQAGYQIGDFLVQVQSGTNWMVAFGQQATQLVGVLPLMGAGFMGLSSGALVALSAGLGIAIPLVTAIGAAFMRTGKDAKDGADGINTFSGAIKALTEEIQKNQDAILKAKFGTDILGVASASQQIQDFESRISSLQVSIDRMRSQGGKAAAFSGLVVGSVEELEAQKKELKDQLAALYESLRVREGIAAAEEASRVQNLYKLQLLDQEQQRLENGRKLLLEILFKYTDINGVLKSASKVDLKAVFEDALPASSALRQFVSDTYTKMLNMSKFQPRDYSGFTYGGAFAEARGAGAAGIVPKVELPVVKDAVVTAGGGGKTDPLAELQKQIALQEELNGKTEAEQKVRQALGDSWATYSPTVIKGLEDQIQKQMDLEERLKDQQAIWDTVSSSMSDAFMSMVDGTKSAKDAFKSMAAAIIKELYNVLVVQQLVGSFSRATGTGSGLVGMIGSALFKADGGPVSAGQPYIVGERGPEMIIPKSSGMVLTNGQTKAALGGSSNESYVVNNNISVTGSDSAMVRQEIAKMIPQISSATKAAMIDAKKRGGQMGNAFR